MSTIVSEVQTNLAYRLGGDSAPTNAAESARRLSFITNAYATTFKRHYWWWTEAETTFTSDSAVDGYNSTNSNLPADIRDIYEIKINNTIYTPIDPQRASEIVQNPYMAFEIPYGIGEPHYYQFGGKLYFQPNLPDAQTVKLKYWKKYTKLTSNSDTLLMPDEFTSCLDAFAFGRISQIDDERGSASDGFDEFEEAMKEMMVEHNKKAFYNKPGA